MLLRQALYGETMDEAKLIGRALPKIPFQAPGPPGGRA